VALNAEGSSSGNFMAITPQDIAATASAGTVEDGGLPVGRVL
jgi:hypothetical protein